MLRRWTNIAVFAGILLVISVVGVLQMVTSSRLTGLVSSGEDGGSSSSFSSQPAIICGDGVQTAAGADGIQGNADDEECDDGPSNSDTGSCTTTCKVASCGDGETQQYGADGVIGGGDDEQCDDGAGNTASGPEDESWCSLTCQLPVCSNGLDDDNDGDVDAGDGMCYEPVNYDLLDGAGDHPASSEESPGEEMGIIRRFFARIFGFLLSQDAGEPIFMPGRSAESGACQQVGEFDPDEVDGVNCDENDQNCEPDPDEQIVIGDPQANQASCAAAGGVGWSEGCGRGCRCAGGSGFINGMCVPTGCAGPYNNGECDASVPDACGNEYCPDGTIQVYKACRVWIDCTTFCQELDLGLQCTGGDGGSDATGRDDSGETAGAPASSAQSSAASSVPSSSTPSSSAQSGISSGASSSSVAQCDSDSDCTPTCTPCDIIPGYGCGKKCHGLICENGRCGGGQQYIFCASNMCPQAPASSSSSSSPASSSRSSSRSSLASSSRTSSRSSSRSSSRLSSAAPSSSPVAFVQSSSRAAVISSSRMSLRSSSVSSSVRQSSSMRTSQSSAWSAVFGTCSRTECRDGGTDFCIAQGAAGCEQTPDAPCIRCVYTQSSASSEKTGCTMTECRDGGEFFCRAQGAEGCRQIGENPCIECVFASSASSASSVASSVQCRFDQDCPSGLCSDGQCAQCEFDDQCSTNRCVLGRCVPCTDNAQCAFDKCMNGVCAECLTDVQCTAGRRCVGNLCLSDQRIAMLPSFCGNARVDAGELCDEGSANSGMPNALCRPDCQPGRCGDGILDTPLELCDDRNSTDGDGCSSKCQFERTAPQTLPASVVELPFATPGQLVAVTPSASVTQTTHPPATADTGPAAIAVMAAGAAAGYAYIRRKKS